MLALLFIAVLIIPTIWLGLFIKWYREDTQLKRANKAEKIQILCQSPKQPAVTQLAKFSSYWTKVQYPD